MSLSTFVHDSFINERLHINSSTKSVHIRPTGRRELKNIIIQELERQGPDADLNHIDTSGITDMSYLFYGLNIRNIKIDEWNVGNVTDMTGMFDGCEKFNCDISKWDTSSVTKMFEMFDHCKNFESDLSGWDVSKVKSHTNMFKMCTKMRKHYPDFYPKSVI